MTNERRRIQRARLSGPFHHMLFTAGTHWIQPTACDASPVGLGITIPLDFDPAQLNKLRISFDDERPSITLELKFVRSYQDERHKGNVLRCGFELSEKDQQRGINLLQLMRESVQIETSEAIAS